MNRIRHYMTSGVMFFIITIVIFLTTGCEVSGLNVENYMRPPAPAGDSAEVLALLNAHLGSEYTLRYPRSGEYRSAVVLRDIDNDSEEEVVVFYRLSTENSGAHMIVFDCTTKGKWKLAGINNGDGDIDRILFGDVNGDGTDEIVTGWTGVSDGHIINVHTLTDGVFQKINIVSGVNDNYPAGQYYEMAVGDFDGDNRDEIMTVFRNPLEGVAVTRILRLGYGIDGSAHMRTAGSIQTDGSVYQYINAQAGYTSFGNFCMVIDGCRGVNKYVTEVIFWDKETNCLATPQNQLGESICTIFERSQPTISQDINGDGMIEIPNDKLLPGYSQRSEEPMYVTYWYKLSRNEAQLVMRAVMRFDHGYYFTFPVDWSGKVTVQPDASTDTMCFYKVDSEQPFSEEIFRIKIFTLDEWDSQKETIANALLDDDDDDDDDSPAYTLLSKTDYYVYASLIATPEGGDMVVNQEILMECFNLIS